MRGWLFAAGLATIWVLLWGSASPANVITGLAIGWLLVLVVPGLRRSGEARRLPARRHRPARVARARHHRHVQRAADP